MKNQHPLSNNLTNPSFRSYNVWIEEEEHISPCALTPSATEDSQEKEPEDGTGQTVTIWLHEEEDLTVRPMTEENADPSDRE